jgi:methylmalonyl-CoA/ethylmalonyl-CoA epimerase
MTGVAMDLNFKLRHIGIAVRSLDETTEVLSRLFGYKLVSGPFTDPIQKVAVSFLATTESDVAEIELITPLEANSAVETMLKKGNGGAYHLCFESSDLDAALIHATQQGCIIVSHPVPAVAFEGRRIAWIYTPSRQLFELVEARAAE